MSNVDEHTFLFADLAGFTALTEAHGDEDAAKLAMEFCDSVRELPPDFGAEEVRTIGDAVMLRCDDPRTSVRRFARGLRHGLIGPEPRALYGLDLRL